MQKKKIETLKVRSTKKMGWITTVQILDDVLILNVYHNGYLKGKHCINTQTYEYAQWKADTKKWCQKKIYDLLEVPTYWYHEKDARERLCFASKAEEKMVIDALKGKENHWKNAYDIIDRRESQYNELKKIKTENNRVNRVREVMDMIPDPPENIHQWIYEVATGSMDYAFYSKDKEKWSCTNCGKSYTEKYLHRADGEKKIRHNDMVICPRCKKTIQVKKRTKKQELITHFVVMQPIDEKISVVRNFDADIYWNDGKREIDINEAIRFVLYQKKDAPRYTCDIYYNQYTNCGAWSGESGWDKEYFYFDNKSNPTKRSTYVGYLYEQGIEETLKGTYYEDWSRLFGQMAAARKKLHYNRLMATRGDLNFIRVIECLFKGKFERLLQESSEAVSYWSGSYYGPLKLSGQTIEDVFDIGDRQKINRIRDLNGGTKILKWMRWSDESGQKIPQEVLLWLTQSNLEQDDVKFITDKMSLQQIMNYVKRQQTEGYKGKTAKNILNQWNDYLSMCERLKKKTDDEMVYRPRELKRRHDEAVEEINRQQRIEEMKRSKKQKAAEAKRMNERFPGAEDVLKEIKPKYEYKGERYMIIVPTRLVDIMAEGQALHHCAGATDRYFDRIMQRETYICFLRSVDAPAAPFYTIEVEPSGTIRQHRGYLDEEPGIEEIKPFLREWQQVIRKRLTKKDKEYAKVSAVKRQQNIEELQAKNNTRVLAGLMEDFMEAAI